MNHRYLFILTQSIIYMEKMYFSKEEPHKKVFEKEKKKFNFLNLYSLYLFETNFKFREAASSDDAINFPDGFPIAKKLKGKQYRGPDFTKNLLTSEFAKNKKHFFIGLDNSDIEKLSNITKIPEKNIKVHNPPHVSGFEFDKKDVDLMKNKINKKKTDYLWICVGNPKQEILGHQLFDDINVEKIFNVGAALDFLLGKEKEAPLIFRKLYLESAYIGIMNPRRALKKVFGSFWALGKLGKVKER